MSVFEKSLGIAGAAVILLVSAGAAVVSAQGPWVAPADAKAMKNPVKGVGNAKKTVETNCVSCHGPGGRATAQPPRRYRPPKPANWTSEAVQKESDGEIFWKLSNGPRRHAALEAPPGERALGARELHSHPEGEVTTPFRCPHAPPGAPAGRLCFRPCASARSTSVATRFGCSSPR